MKALETGAARQPVTKEGLVELIQAQATKSHKDRPAFVALSGFGGSGKSSLALEVARMLEDSVVIPIDDFIVGARDERSADWRTFDRARLRRDILESARPGESLSYQKYNSGDYVNGKGGELVQVAIGRTVIVEGCGILHPELMGYYDASAWIAMPQEAALASAKQRDSSEGDLFGDDDTAALWDEVWGPNDKNFFDTFRPDFAATVLVEPQF